MHVLEKALTLKDNTRILIKSIDLDDTEKFRDFLDQVFLENKDKRTLVADYKRMDIVKIIGEAKKSNTDIILGGFIDNELVAVLDFIDSTLDNDAHYIGEVGVTVKKRFWSFGIATLLLKYITPLSSRAVIRRCNSFRFFDF